MNHTKRAAFRAAFPHTLPVMTGYLCLGTAYGIFMKTSGFPWFFPTLTSLIVFAGAMEFVTVNLLLQAFNPLNALHFWRKNTLLSIAAGTICYMALVQFVFV